MRSTPPTCQRRPTKKAIEWGYRLQRAFSLLSLHREMASRRPAPWWRAVGGGSNITSMIRPRSKQSWDQLMLLFLRLLQMIQHEPSEKWNLQSLEPWWFLTLFQCVLLSRWHYFPFICCTKPESSTESKKRKCHCMLVSFVAGRWWDSSLLHASVLSWTHLLRTIPIHSPASGYVIISAYWTFSLYLHSIRKWGGRNVVP